MKYIILLLLTPMLFAASSEQEDSSKAQVLAANETFVDGTFKAMEDIFDGSKTVPQGVAAIGEAFTERGYKAIGSILQHRLEIHIHEVPKPINRSLWCRPDMQMLYVGVGGAALSLLGYYLIMRGMSE